MNISRHRSYLVVGMVLGMMRAWGSMVTNEVTWVRDVWTAGTADVRQWEPRAGMTTNRFETIELTVEGVVAGTMPCVEGEPRAAMALVAEEGGAGWWGWCAGEWVRVGPGVEGTSCVVRVEMDNRGEKARVRYAILGMWCGEWLTGDAAGAGCVARVETEAAALRGARAEQTGRLCVASEGKFEQRRKEWGVEDLNAVAANGFARWENLAMGLGDGEKPVAVGRQEGGRLVLRLGGVACDESIALKYCVISSSERGGEDAVSAPLDATEAYTPTLPSEGVRYYRIRPHLILGE